MNAIERSRVGLVLVTCLFASPLFAQPNHYKEAHVYITGPSTPAAITNLAVENVRPMLLADRGFQTLDAQNKPCPDSL